MEVDHSQFVQTQPLSHGDGKTRANKGDTVRVEYRGWLNEDGQKGRSFDASSDFATTIGEGRVIKGWEVVIPDMILGEKSILLIDRSYATGGSGGFRASIPSNTDLIYHVKLNGIKRKGESKWLNCLQSNGRYAEEMV